MSEVNPNHAVTAAVREHWQKIAGLLVAKQGGHVVITADDVLKLNEGDGLFLTVQELHDGIHLRLVGKDDATAIARREGGLPT